MTSQNLQQRHIESCAQDIARIARLIVAGHDQGGNLHSSFVRQATTARRYNREHLPARAIEIENLFTGALGNDQQNFRAIFTAAQSGPRLQVDDSSREEIISRVLADSSPYLDPLMKWMERNHTAGTFAQYSDPERAIRVLRQSPVIKIRSEEELSNLISQGMQPRQD